MTVSPKEMDAILGSYCIGRVEHDARYCGRTQHTDCSGMQAAPDGEYVRFDCLDDLLDDFSRMRQICGPSCPKCGHFLRAEHHQSMGFTTDLSCHACADNGERCLIAQSELLSDSPEVAREMGIV